MGLWLPAASTTEVQNKADKSSQQLMVASLCQPWNRHDGLMNRLAVMAEIKAMY